MMWETINKSKAKKFDKFTMAKFLPTGDTRESGIFMIGCNNDPSIPSTKTS